MEEFVLIPFATADCLFCITSLLTPFVYLAFFLSYFDRSIHYDGCRRTSWGGSRYLAWGDSGVHSRLLPPLIGLLWIDGNRPHRQTLKHMPAVASVGREQLVVRELVSIDMCNKCDFVCVEISSSENPIHGRGRRSPLSSWTTVGPWSTTFQSTRFQHRPSATRLEIDVLC